MLANRIMIVEDEGIIAMDLRHQLESFGYEVIDTAFSGEQAITLAQRHKPDLVMMDIVLKGTMDGISAAQAITGSQHIPIIFLTAYSDPATLKRAKTTGAYGYLVKPFRPDELHASIEVALHKHQLEKKIKEREQWFAKTLKGISDAVIATDAEGKIRFMNPGAEQSLAIRFEQAQGISIGKLMTLLSEQDRTKIDNPISAALVRLEAQRSDDAALLVTPSGAEFPIDYSAAPILNEEGKLLGAVLVFRNISGHRQMEVQLRESEERFSSAFAFAPIGMAMTAIDGRVLQVNSALCDICGYSESELLMSNLLMLTYDDDRHKVLSQFVEKLRTNELSSFQVEKTFKHKIIGKQVWVSLSASLVRNLDGQPLHLIFQIQDITDRKHAEQQLAYFANHDSLTGLLNRAQFQNNLGFALSSVRRHETKLALMFIDLDRFKLVNDTLGHRIGDLLLQAVSEQLRKSIRDYDTLARLGGDEFVVLLTDINNVDDVARIAQKTLEILTRPFTIEQYDIAITASIGISIYPDDGENCQSLLMNADAAMYLAKERGKNKYQFYKAEMTARSIERMNIERGLRNALSNNELRLHYQPQIDVLSGRAASVEALVRWQHPEWGLVYPDRFISVAEETGLIVPIGFWVLRTACEQIKCWQDNGGPFRQVAVNLSPRQFLEPDLFPTIQQILIDTGLEPASLELEITESAVMQDSKRTLHVLHQLHALGVRISIDDFGTGHSSLSYLRRFPVHGLKLDRAFIFDIPKNENGKRLVRAIIALGHELNLQVIAEGVETEDQLKFLMEQKCDFLQGYIFSRAVEPKYLENDFNIDAFKSFFNSQ